MHDVLTNGADRLIQPWQSRKQVMVMEECHRQNPLPKRPQSIQPSLSLDEELAVAVDDAVKAPACSAAPLFYHLPTILRDLFCVFPPEGSRRLRILKEGSKANRRSYGACSDPGSRENSGAADVKTSRLNRACCIRMHRTPCARVLN